MLRVSQSPRFGLYLPFPTKPIPPLDRGSLTKESHVLPNTQESGKALSLFLRQYCAVKGEFKFGLGTALPNVDIDYLSIELPEKNRPLSQQIVQERKARFLLNKQHAAIQTMIYFDPAQNIYVFKGRFRTDPPKGWDLTFTADQAGRREVILSNDGKIAFLTTADAAQDQQWSEPMFNTLLKMFNTLISSREVRANTGIENNLQGHPPELTSNLNTFTAFPSGFLSHSPDLAELEAALSAGEALSIPDVKIEPPSPADLAARFEIILDSYRQGWGFAKALRNSGLSLAQATPLFRTPDGRRRAIETWEQINPDTSLGKAHYPLAFWKKVVTHLRQGKSVIDAVKQSLSILPNDKQGDLGRVLDAFRNKLENDRIFACVIRSISPQPEGLTPKTPKPREM